ncbi:hypothetical protein C8F04DRAFT_600371 [Mycena alexandri]|uniref:F-box domain-containing protein n=1 Tax=Mycena alexandri TaxID=1745969 RepID=A0AAD6STY7_9AGAR|nr:hypothetical protein C8F04DRAFT_600371 [Mycena alexandri]
MTSPFASKLGTNYYPLDDEVLEIRALLVEPLSRLKRLDDQIAYLQKAIDELAQERESVRTFVDSHNELISPFRRLPLDIIQEISVACLPTHRNSVMSAVEAPILLGRICSSWRAISLTTPRLWSRLHIVEPSRLGVADAVFEEKLAQRVETTKTWLGRSGKCPLSISFQGCPDIPVPPGAISNDVFIPNTSHLFMQAIIPFTPRWQSITLCASSMVLETLSSITEDDVPLLQKLVISQHFGTASFLTLPPPTFALLRAPKLIDLTFGGSHANTQNLPIRWENLTHLSLMGYSDSSLTCRLVLQLLARCSQLQSCSLYFHQDDNSLPLTDEAGRTIELPFLHSLDISSVGFQPNGLGNVFRRLSLVALRHLDLRGHRESGLENPSFVTDLLAFLGVSLCFESLKIDTATFTTSSLTELLRGLPSSTARLHITGTFSWRLAPANGILNGILYDDVITVLTPTPQNPGICPALQELHIARCMSLSDEALLRFIKARMTAAHPTLRKVVITFSREMQVDIAQDIQPFSDDGRLEVITTYAQPPQPRAVGSFSPWQGLPDAPELADWAPMDDF